MMSRDGSWLKIAAFDDAAYSFSFHDISTIYHISFQPHVAESSCPASKCEMWLPEDVREDPRQGEQSSTHGTTSKFILPTSSVCSGSQRARKATGIGVYFAGCLCRL